MKNIVNNEITILALHQDQKTISRAIELFPQGQTIKTGDSRAYGVYVQDDRTDDIVNKLQTEFPEATIHEGIVNETRIISVNGQGV